MVNETGGAKTAQKNEHEHVACRISTAEAKQLDALINAGMFLNRSDAVRTAIREMLSGIRVLKVREISLRQAKKEIADYLEDHERAYPSDIADALHLDYDVVLRALRELRASGEAEPI